MVFARVDLVFFQFVYFVCFYNTINGMGGVLYGGLLRNSTYKVVS